MGARGETEHNKTDENIQNIWHDNYYYTKSNFGLNSKQLKINQCTYLNTHTHTHIEFPWVGNAYSQIECKLKGKRKRERVYELLRSVSILLFIAHGIVYHRGISRLHIK